MKSKKVAFGRLSTVTLMVFGVLLAWSQMPCRHFNHLLMIGAGTGLLYILRWFWWRIMPTQRFRPWWLQQHFPWYSYLSNFGLHPVR